MGDVEDTEYKSLEKRYQEQVKPKSVDARKDTLRSIPIHPDIKAAMDPELYKKFETREAIDETNISNRRLSDILKANQSAKIEGIKGLNNTFENYIITSSVNERLTSVMITNTQVQSGEEVYLGMGLDRPIYDYLIATNIFLINQNGEVIDLEKYIPYHYRTHEKEIRIMLNDSMLGFARASPRRVGVRPIVAMKDLLTFIHEGGHLFAYDVNPYKYKYSQERDAAAFLMTAVRELERRRFLVHDDVIELITIQKDYLKIYQDDDTQDPGWLPSGLLAPRLAFTQEGANYSKFLERQRRKPLQEQKKWTPKFEALIGSFKDLATNIIPKGLELRKVYGIEKGRKLFDSKNEYFLTTDGFFKLSPEIDSVRLDQYHLTNNQAVVIRRYDLQRDKIYISQEEYGKNDYLHPVETSRDSLKFGEPQEELGVDRAKFEEARSIMVSFFEKAEKGQIEKTMLEPDEVFAFLKSTPKKVA